MLAERESEQHSTAGFHSLFASVTTYDIKDSILPPVFVLPLGRIHVCKLRACMEPWEKWVPRDVTREAREPGRAHREVTSHTPQRG